MEIVDRGMGLLEMYYCARAQALLQTRACGRVLPDNALFKCMRCGDCDVIGKPIFLIGGDEISVNMFQVVLL
jgi:hypothetical protein